MLGFWAAVCVCVWLITPVGGTCGDGVTKYHLDKTADAFIDGDTFEINDCILLGPDILPFSRNGERV
jgi:hypothetical protein